MMKHENFAVFILSHGRAGNMLTVETLRKDKYTGKIYIIIDDEDDQEQEYRERFGESIIQFCKIKAAETTDVMSPSKKRNAVVFARNECHKIAEQLGLTHFLVLDDDYVAFEFRYPKDPKLMTKEAKTWILFLMK